MQLLLRQPLALIPVNGQIPVIEGEIGPKNGCSARPWGRQAVILVNERCLLVDCLGHSASALHDSAVSAGGIRFVGKRIFAEKRIRTRIIFDSDSDSPFGTGRFAIRIRIRLRRHRRLIFLVRESGTSNIAI